MKFHNPLHGEKVLKTFPDGGKGHIQNIGYQSGTIATSSTGRGSSKGMSPLRGGNITSLRVPHPAKMSGVREETCKIHSPGDENPLLHSLSQLVVRRCAPSK